MWFVFLLDCLVYDFTINGLKFFKNVHFVHQYFYVSKTSLIDPPYIQFLKIASLSAAFHPGNHFQFIKAT